MGLLAALIKDDESDVDANFVAFQRSYSIFNQILTVTTSLVLLVGIELLYNKSESAIVLLIYIILGLSLALYLYCGIKVLIKAGMLLIKQRFNIKAHIAPWISGSISFAASMFIAFSAAPLITNLTSIGFLQPETPSTKLQTKEKIKQPKNVMWDYYILDV